MNSSPAPASPCSSTTPGPAAASAGWVPKRCLDTSSDPAVVLAGYDTTELTTTAGEELTLVGRDDPSGWAWVRNAAGQEGWVPLRTVAPVPGA